MISSGMSIQRCALISCSMRAIGNSGARSSGRTGCLVTGCSGGRRGVLKSAAMLYHCRGMSRSANTIFVSLNSAQLLSARNMCLYSLRPSPLLSPPASRRLWLTRNPELAARRRRVVVAAPGRVFAGQPQLPGDGLVHLGDKLRHRLLRAQHGGDVRVVGHQFRRSEEHTSELQSRENLVCRLLLEKKKTCA